MVQPSGIVRRPQIIGFPAVLAVRPIHAAAGVLVALLVAASARAEQGNAADSADLVLKSGAIYTVDGARTWAQAVAIRAGHIVYVGTDRGAADYVTPSTRVVDLKGKMVLPSFLQRVVRVKTDFVHLIPYASPLRDLSPERSAHQSEPRRTDR